MGSAKNSPDQPVINNSIGIRSSPQDHNQIAIRAGIAVPNCSKTRREPAKAATPPTRKGSRTRERLKAAALTVLEKKGYRSLRLSDIAQEANVNISLVYHYFQDKADLVFEALRDVVNVRHRILSDDERPHGPFAALFYANKRFADFYQQNPGLVRSLLHFDEENPEFHHLYEEVKHTWLDYVAFKMHKRWGGIKLTSEEIFPISYALGAMVEKFLFDLYVERQPKLLQSFPTSTDAGRFLAILWYRAFYLTNPSADDLASFVKFSELKLENITEIEKQSTNP